jgi:hypothetical protein
LVGAVLDLHGDRDRGVIDHPASTDPLNVMCGFPGLSDSEGSRTVEHEEKQDHGEHGTKGTEVASSPACDFLASVVVQFRARVVSSV